jgi:hypothetical protein
MPASAIRARKRVAIVLNPDYFSARFESGAGGEMSPAAIPFFGKDSAAIPALTRAAHSAVVADGRECIESVDYCSDQLGDGIGAVGESEGSPAVVAGVYGYAGYGEAVTFTGCVKRNRGFFHQLAAAGAHGGRRFHNVIPITKILTGFNRNPRIFGH